MPSKPTHSSSTARGAYRPTHLEDTPVAAGNSASSASRGTSGGTYSVGSGDARYSDRRAMDLSDGSASQRDEFVRRPLLWRVFWAAVASAALLWAAFPPVSATALVWIAPLGLLWLIDRVPPPTRGGYFWIWFAGSLFWLAILQGIRLAFWPLIFGWLALVLYLAIYWPLFVLIARILRHRWQWSLVWSAPVAWTGMELVRSYMLTGYPGNTLAHTQVHHPLLLQSADQWGGYGIGFVIMAVAVAIYRTLEVGSLRYASSSQDAAALRGSSASPNQAEPPTGVLANERIVGRETSFAGPRSLHRRNRFWDWIIPACLLAAVVGYGSWRLRQGDRLTADAKPLLRVVLIQENTPSMFDADRDRLQLAWTRYARATAQALLTSDQIDLIVWPESTFTGLIPWMEDQTTERVPSEMEEQFDRQSLRALATSYQHEFDRKSRTLIDEMDRTRGRALGGPHLLVGNDVVVFNDDRVARYNAALLLDPTGRILSQYEKVHMVMFGEYIPLEWALGFLGRTFGFSSATPGTDAKSFEVSGVRIAPSICFESMIPQMMSWQMRTLTARGESPDILINITNDSWFRGSSILDHHLASDVMTAVEMRRPMLVAANTGLSAWIEGTGRIRQVSPRLESHTIVADCKADGRWGLTQTWGDLPAWSMAAICGLALLTQTRRRPRTRP